MGQNLGFGNALAAGCMAAALLVAQDILAPSTGVAMAQTKTMKERLSDKGADEQRVNNCRVPAERRGTTPRPGCADEAKSSSPKRSNP